MLEVGRVVRPHGLRGEVVVELWTNRQERVEAGATLTGPTGPLHVRSASRAKPSRGWDRWVVDFSGIDDRDQAEGLRGAILKAEAVDEPGALWVHELVGAAVLDPDGTRIGTVQAVEKNPASDLLVLDDGRLVPLRFVTGQAPGRVVVDVPPGLLEL